MQCDSPAMQLSAAVALQGAAGGWLGAAWGLSQDPAAQQAAQLGLQTQLPRRYLVTPVRQAILRVLSSGEDAELEHLVAQLGTVMAVLILPDCIQMLGAGALQVGPPVGVRLLLCRQRSGARGAGPCAAQACNSITWPVGPQLQQLTPPGLPGPCSDGIRAERESVPGLAQLHCMARLLARHCCQAG